MVRRRAAQEQEEFINDERGEVDPEKEAIFIKAIQRITMAERELTRGWQVVEIKDRRRLRRSHSRR